MAILQKEPWRADKWIDDEENKEFNPNGFTYLKGKTMRQIRDAALLLKTNYDLNEVEPAFNCACVS